jgi:L-serine dehydratase
MEAMESLRELYRIGAGPSSSHTMGPQRAALRFRARHPADAYRVTFYGSLGATGRGHQADLAVERAFAPARVELLWRPEVVLPFHPNGMDFEAPAPGARWRVYSIGGGALREEGEAPPAPTYAVSTMEAVLAWCGREGEPLWRLAEVSEGPAVWDFLAECWTAMQAAIRRGLEAEGALPGGLKLRRKAKELRLRSAPGGATGRLSSYAHAVMEENAAAGIVVTAPTCGACGTLPAVLKHLQDVNGVGDRDVLRALATAGLVGLLVKTNASISGAEVGCQGEVGTACAMAAAAAAQLLGATPRQVEYAAEMGLEHHLGLTCDPVLGLVQIPCIERNAFAATRALSCAEYALLGDGSHRVSFDQVVRTMAETGRSLPSAFRETSEGGLARVLRAAAHPM